MSVISYESSGGFIIAGGRMLLVRRPSTGEVRTPKGHIEVGESRQQAALREVREETGCDDIEILADLGTVKNRFVHQGHEVHRTESYFLMGLRESGRCGDRPLRRRPEEFELLWIPLDEAPDLLTFEPERSMARKAVEVWRASGPDA